MNDQAVIQLIESMRKDMNKGFKALSEEMKAHRCEDIKNLEKEVKAHIETDKRLKRGGIAVFMSLFSAAVWIIFKMPGKAYIGVIELVKVFRGYFS